LYKTISDPGHPGEGEKGQACHTVEIHVCPG
jgi:hypothetical protein